MTNNGMSRRQFIGGASAGLVSAGLGLGGTRPRTAGRMESRVTTRPLGKTGLELPIVSFGVMNSDSPDLINRALESGITHLDTAHLYLRGKSEQVIGEVVQRRGNRKDVIIATKMRFNRDSEKGVFLLTGAGRQPGATAENLDTQLELSLKRLRTDYVDILYLHSCYSPEMATFEPLMNALLNVKKQGKARFIGVSTHNDEPRVIRAAVDAGIYDVVLTAYNLVLERRQQIKEAIQYAVDKGVGVVAMKTQGGARLQQEGNVQIKHAAALKWVLQDENVCTTIPGMTTFDQLDLNLKTMGDLTMTPEEERDILAAQGLNGILYCQGCRDCLKSCPHSVEIPKLMRAYMYAEGYGNPLLARETIAELPSGRGLDRCLECSSCPSQCRNGIRIGQRIRNMIEGQLHVG